MQVPYEYDIGTAAVRTAPALRGTVSGVSLWEVWKNEWKQTPSDASQLPRIVHTLSEGRCESVNLPDSQLYMHTGFFTNQIHEIQ